jgi:hypothetical protein
MEVLYPRTIHSPPGTLKGHNGNKMLLLPTVFGFLEFSNAFNFYSQQILVVITGMNMSNGYRKNFNNSN